jgi:hypothetical protein
VRGTKERELSGELVQELPCSGDVRVNVRLVDGVGDRGTGCGDGVPDAAVEQEDLAGVGQGQVLTVALFDDVGVMGGDDVGGVGNAPLGVLAGRSSSW